MSGSIRHLARRFGRGVGGVGGGTDPYPLYTAFDRNELPFHTAAGSWGAQVPFQAPTPPTTTRQVTVTTTGQFNTEAAVAGTEVTVGADFAESSIVTINANDVDVIVPSGRSIGGLIFASHGGTGRSRMRVRKATVDTRGGRVGEMRSASVATGQNTDIIIDSIDVNGCGDFGNAAENNMAFYLSGNTGQMALRVFIHNVRAISGQATGFFHADHMLIANCSIRASGVDRTTADRAEGWAYRGGGTPSVIVDSQIETTRYHVLRPNTHGLANEYFYIARTVLMNLSESKIGWLGNRLATPSTDEYWWAAWVKDCTIYSGADSTCNGSGGTDSQLFSLNSCTYSRITGNTIYSGGTGNAKTWALSNLTSERNTAISNANASSLMISVGRAPLPADAHSSDADLATNTFSTLTGRPSWGSAGDPTAVPLPNSWTVDDDNLDGFGGAPICDNVW